MSSTNKWESNEELNIFREYLRIPSVHPDPEYAPCVNFLRKQAENLGLPIQVHYAGGNLRKPFVVITWTGSEPNLPSVLLNSHMDVVPVYRDSWAHDPFSADMDDEGRIHARGSQDTKCVGVQYLAAIQKLKRQGFTPKRTLHVMFVPDEEIGGSAGMQVITTMKEFHDLNVGFALDEGLASENAVFTIFYAERPPWWLTVTCPGSTGHGSQLHKATAGEKVASVLANFTQYRATELQKLKDNPALTMGDVTTMNLTVLEGGVQVNVLPPEMRIRFDVRLAIDVVHSEFEEMLNNWCREAGDDVTLSFAVKTPSVPPTKLDDSNPFWIAFEQAIKELNLDTVKRVCIGGTDSRFLRALNIPAIGFSPINNTTVLLHNNDEYLGAAKRNRDLHEAVGQTCQYCLRHLSKLDTTNKCIIKRFIVLALLLSYIIVINIGYLIHHPKIHFAIFLEHKINYN